MPPGNECSYTANTQWQTTLREPAIPGCVTLVEAVRSAALADLGELPIRITWTNVMSVYVPGIEHPEPARSPIDGGYSLSLALTRE